MQKSWLKQDPRGVAAKVRTDLYPSLVALLDENLLEYRDLPAYRFMRRSCSCGRVDDLSPALAACLQSLRLVRGDRVAVMLPNLPRYPVAVAATRRAGSVVVNVIPVYAARELEHPLKDSGARAVVVLGNFAAPLQQVLRTVPTGHDLNPAMRDLLQELAGERFRSVPAICEGNGLSETSPSVTCNPTDGSGSAAPGGGNTGLALPRTEPALLDDAGSDMILVSGFNVCPNEVEEVVTQMPGVLECAVVGIADAKACKAVKPVLVKTDQHSASSNEAGVLGYCQASVTGYKRPKVVEFRGELPKTPVVQVLRRELREQP